jgi:Autotransporter beta-domain
MQFGHFTGARALAAVALSFIGLAGLPSMAMAQAPTSTSLTGAQIAAVTQAAGALAATQQNLSFGAVATQLQLRRDELQGSFGRSSTTLVTGYAPSQLEDAPLGYASKSQHPLAAFKAPAAPPPNPGPSWAVWGQGLGDWVRVGPTNAFDLEHFASTYSGLGGVDATWQRLMSSNDALIVGAFGNWTTSHVTFNGTPASAQLEGPGFGVYGTYVWGGFSIDATGKFDFLRLSEDFGGLIPALGTLGTDVTNAGVSSNIQYKFKLGATSFIEPTAGIAYTRTSFGGGATALGLTDASTLRVQGGARVGMAWDTPNAIVQATLKGLVYSNVIAQGTSIQNSTFGLAGVPLSLGIIPTDAGKVRGELNPALNLDFRNSYTAFLDGSVRFGEGLLGGTVKVGVRKQW